MKIYECCSLEYYIVNKRRVCKIVKRTFLKTNYHFLQYTLLFNLLQFFDVDYVKVF